MAFRRHNPQWLGVYRSDSGNYIRSGEPVVVGGSSGYNTLIGFNSTAMLEDINTSKVQPRIHLRMNVTDAGTFDYGVHKSTTNKASNGIPFYRWTGRSFFPNTGSRSYDITDFNVTVDGTNNLIDAMENEGYHGIVLYGGVGGAYGVSENVYIEIEGTWNEPPSKPTITFPTGGETLNGEQTFTATEATDPEGDTLTYQWAVKDPDGWYSFYREDTPNKLVDLSTFKETSSAQARVRAYDGQSYGEWAYSNIFTIRHNVAPSKPTLNEPVGGVSRDRTKTIRFLWTHNDDDPQSLFRFRWRVQGTTTWNEQETVTTDELVAIPGGTFPAGNIEWQIQTEDQGGLVSPWSSSGLFLSTEQSNAPTITSPSNGAVIPTESLTVTWSSSGQEQYEVEVADNSTVIWSVSRSSGNKGVSVGESLVNNTTYTIRVRIADSGGLWSDWASVSITTDFTEPPQAELSVSSNESAAAIYVDIHNPLPGGTEPNVTHNDLYRRRRGETWKRIAKNLTPDTGYMDYTPAGNVVYEYRVTSYGDNDTTVDSVAAIGSVEVKRTRLSLASNPTIYVELFMAEQRNFNYSMGSTTHRFAGRTKPVVEYGEVIDNNGSLEYLVQKDDLDNLRELALSRQTLIYRDRRNRKQYVAVTGLQITDEEAELYQVSVPMTEVDYREEV